MIWTISVSGNGESKNFLNWIVITMNKFILTGKVIILIGYIYNVFFNKWYFVCILLGNLYTKVSEGTKGLIRGEGELVYPAMP